MAKKRSEQLEREVREALSRIPKKSLKTREQLDAEIDAILAEGLQAERYEVAQALGYRYPKKSPPKKMTITGTNLFALASLVMEAGGRSTISNRLHATDRPHIQRTLTAGLVEVSSPTTLTLTPAGHEAVLNDLRKNYREASEGFARDPSRYDARARQRIEKLRVAIENLEAGT